MSLVDPSTGRLFVDFDQRTSPSNLFGQKRGIASYSQDSILKMFYEVLGRTITVKLDEKEYCINRRSLIKFLAANKTDFTYQNDETLAKALQEFYTTKNSSTSLSASSHEQAPPPPQPPPAVPTAIRAPGLSRKQDGNLSEGSAAVETLIDQMGQLRITDDEKQLVRTRCQGIPARSTQDPILRAPINRTERIPVWQPEGCTYLDCGGHKIAFSIDGAPGYVLKVVRDDLSSEVSRETARSNVSDKEAYTLCQALHLDVVPPIYEIVSPQAQEATGANLPQSDIHMRSAILAAITKAKELYPRSEIVLQRQIQGKTADKPPYPKPNLQSAQEVLLFNIIISGRPDVGPSNSMIDTTGRVWEIDNKTCVPGPHFMSRYIFRNGQNPHWLIGYERGAIWNTPLATDVLKKICEGEHTFSEDQKDLHRNWLIVRTAIQMLGGADTEDITFDALIGKLEEAKMKVTSAERVLNGQSWEQNVEESLRRSQPPPPTLGGRSGSSDGGPGKGRRGKGPPPSGPRGTFQHPPRFPGAGGGGRRGQGRGR